MERIVNILLIDDHVLFREGMELVLQRIYPEVRVGHASNVDAGVRRLLQEPPDLVLTDLNFPGVQGIEALVRVRTANDAVPAVVLAGSEEPAVVRSAIDLGAMGYIPKSSDSGEVSRALRLTLRGGVYLPPVALATDRTRAAQGPALTPRQREVLLKLIQGKPNKVIARELEISDATVKTHVAALLQALEVDNRTQAVYAVARLGVALGEAAP